MRRTTEDRLAGGQQTARLSDVMFSQNDSTACLWAVNGELCAVASGPPHPSSCLPGLPVSLLPLVTSYSPCPGTHGYRIHALPLDVTPAQGMSPCCLCHISPISMLKKDLSARQTCVLLLPLPPPG